MEQDEMQERTHSVWLTYYAMEMIASAVIFVVGVVMMIEGYRIGMGWAFDGPESGYFPFRTGAILSSASGVIFVRTLFGKHRNDLLFVPWDRLKTVLYMLVPTVLYVLATQFIGIYVASAVFIGGFMRAMGKFSWVKIILISAGVSVTLFWMFQIQFKVSLPKGPLEHLLGY